MNYTPVIIIGAGRSGTNMLRDIITTLPSFNTWDCDEVNPIWRYGNKRYETDELPTNLVSTRIKKYIRGRFSKMYKEDSAQYIVEKTCANSLRLNYVYEIFPEAKFIIINRDGRDVVPSAMKRWNSSLDLKYTLKKFRYVPLVDLFFYTWKFGKNRFVRFVNKRQALSFWGPIYKGIDRDIEQLSLMEVCAKQWQMCAENTMSHRKNIPESNVFDVKYETFVNDPKEEMTKLLKFLSVDKETIDLDHLTKGVSTKSVGNYKRNFSKDKIKKLNAILGSTLKKLDYEI
jgi:hypothetical protein